MVKLDLTKQYKSYYTAKGKPELVTIEEAHYISITGKGDPAEQPFADRIAALYSTAYALKFMFKAKNNDFTVSKLEGLWWYDEEKYSGKTITTATEVPRSEWEYRLLIRLPDFVSARDIEKAVAVTMSKKDLPLVKQVEYFTMKEGKTIQMLHVGPFATEPETLKQILAFATANQLTKNGLHHEIYLSDFRKTAPENLKTILREPVRSM